MTTPRRIRWTRFDGPKPANAVLCTRPYPLGNPFDFRVYGRHAAVRMHRQWFTDPHAEPRRCGRKTYYPLSYPQTRQRIEALRGHDAACSCPVDGLPCHADLLLEVAATLTERTPN